MDRLRAASLFAALGATAALAGCGSSGDGRSSAADYRRQATKICEDANQRAGALKRPRDLPGLRNYLDRTLAIVQEDTDRLRRLKPPAELQTGHDAALRAQAAAIKQLRSLRRQLDVAKPSVKSLQAGLDDVQRLGDQADRRFRDLGLERCAD